MSDDTQAAAEEAVATALFGPGEEEVEEEYQPDPKPVVEGEESEVEVTEEASEPEDETGEMIEVEWEGQLIEAPKAVAEALMRNKDYTEKTQAVASERKTLEVQAENLKLVNGQYEFAQQVQGDAIKANQLNEQIEQTRAYLRDNVGELSHTDIERIRIAIDDATQNRDKIIQEITTKNTEFQQAREQSLKELRDKSTEVLRQKVPGWGEKQETEIRDYALSLGVPEQMYNSVVDPVEKEILYKAMQYDALKSGVVPAVKTVQAAPKIKSRNPMPKETQDKLNLRKKIKNPKTSKQDKASLIGEDLAARFGM